LLKWLFLEARSPVFFPKPYPLSTLSFYFLAKIKRMPLQSGLQERTFLYFKIIIKAFLSSFDKAFKNLLALKRQCFLNVS